MSRRKLAVESVAFGLGYAAVLVWIGSALVASFGHSGANPYWPYIPRLRTDTSGVIAFAVAIVAISLSRYLQLRRSSGTSGPPAEEKPARILVIQAVAETAVVLASGMVLYLSFNAVAHPVTLTLQVTHLWPWPSEGTARVIGLAVCLIGTATSRFLRVAALDSPGTTAPVSKAEPGFPAYRGEIPSRGKSSDGRDAQEV